MPYPFSKTQTEYQIFEILVPSMVKLEMQEDVKSCSDAVKLKNTGANGPRTPHVAVKYSRNMHVVIKLFILLKNPFSLFMTPSSQSQAYFQLLYIFHDYINFYLPENEFCSSPARQFVPFSLPYRPSGNLVFPFNVQCSSLPELQVQGNPNLGSSFLDKIHFLGRCSLPCAIVLNNFQKIEEMHVPTSSTIASLTHVIIVHHSGLHLKEKLNNTQRLLGTPILCIHTL